MKKFFLSMAIIAAVVSANAQTAKKDINQVNSTAVVTPGAKATTTATKGGKEVSKNATAKPVRTTTTSREVSKTNSTATAKPAVSNTKPAEVAKKDNAPQKK